MAEGKNILLLSELAHVDVYQRFLDEHASIKEEGYTLVPLDAEIEYTLGQKGIPFLSAKEYRTPDATRMIKSEEWASAIFEASEWSFFTYRDVSLGQLYFPQLQGYTNRLLYYADIVSNLVAAHGGVRRIVVFPSFALRPPMGSCLTDHQMRVLGDVVALIAAQKNIEALVLPTAVAAGAPSRRIFTLKRTVFGWVVSVLNTAMSVVAYLQPKGVRILASDYWKNLAPSLSHIRSAEVFLLDRQEIFNAGISNVWKFRMRFLHLDAYHASLEHRDVKELFARTWQTISTKGIGTFVFGNVSMEPLLVSALDSIVQNAKEEALQSIDNAHALVKKLTPQVVMLRATISSQLHFGILAQVARSLSIPSIEMQHGLMYFGPGSTGKRHAAEFMGVYGALVEQEMQAAGDTRSTPVIIGSPRFDVYASLRQTTTSTPSQKITFLAVAPLVFPEESTDSWDVVDYFKAVAVAVRPIPNAHIILKLRPGPNRDSFLRDTIASFFDGISYTVAQFEPLSDLYSETDVVISGYSTAALEALQCGKPLVYLGLCPLERMTGTQHFTPYVEAGAMRLATSIQELSEALEEIAKNTNLRQQLSANAISFLAREYAFDGKASERAAACIEKMAQHSTLL